MSIELDRRQVPSPPKIDYLRNSSSQDSVVATAFLGSGTAAQMLEYLHPACRAPQSHRTEVRLNDYSEQRGMIG